MNETEFRIDFLKKVERRFPGILVVKADSTFIQGIPDRFLFYKDRWVALEFKRSRLASKRANQEYYVDLLNKMSYSDFVFPENILEVLDGIQRAFGFER